MCIQAVHLASNTSPWWTSFWSSRRWRSLRWSQALKQPINMKCSTQWVNMWVNYWLRMIYLLVNFRFMQPKRTQTVALECVVVLTGEHFICNTQSLYIVHIREFGMNITDLMGQDVIHLNRPYMCSSCCCFCCLQVKLEHIFTSRQIISISACPRKFSQKAEKGRKRSYVERSEP